MTSALGNARSCRQILFERTKIYLSVYNQRLLNAQRLLCAFAKLQKATLSFIICVCPPVRLSVRINSAPIGRMFMKSDLEYFFRKSAEV